MQMTSEQLIKVNLAKLCRYMWQPFGVILISCELIPRSEYSHASSKSRPELRWEGCGCWELRGERKSKARVFPLLSWESITEMFNLHVTKDADSTSALRLSLTSLRILLCHSCAFIVVTTVQREGPGCSPTTIWQQWQQDLPKMGCSAPSEHLPYPTNVIWDLSPWFSDSEMKVLPNEPS